MKSAAARLLMLAPLAWCLRNTAQPPDAWLTVADEARAACARLLSAYRFTLDAARRAGIEEALREFGRGEEHRWAVTQTHTSLSALEIYDRLREADRRSSAAAQMAAEAFERLPGWVDWNSSGASARIDLPNRTALLLVRRHGPAPPRFCWKQVSLRKAAGVDLGVGGAFYCVLELSDPPEGTGSAPLMLADSTGATMSLRLETSTPPRFSVEIDLRDENGKPTDAAAAVYSASGEFLTSDTALSFADAGFYYQPVRSRDHGNARFWPGESGYTRAFFERGRFHMDLAAGTYRLLASKGPEYVAIDRTFTVDGRTQVRADLKRWIDMGARGWHSGDCHVHFARPAERANAQAQQWAQAEDLHMTNILRMGDAETTYFEQYAFGRAGRFLFSGGALVPGQEDPRTSVMGHTMHLGIQAPVRNPDDYYLYAPVFDATRKQGGVAGYAHVNRELFTVRRDMSLNIPRGKVDFAEIAEFGSVKPDLYYEFLNLGFRIAAAGGSDAPWGGTAGDARTYVYTGSSRFSPDAWLAGLRQGRTFVTTGPLLDFTVEGRLPGDEIQARKGEPVVIRAKVSAGYSSKAPGRIEIVGNGDVLRSSESGEIEFKLLAARSLWLAARTRDAHTSPVYLVVEGGRTWRVSAVGDLIDRRERDLAGIEKLIDRNAADLRLGTVSNRESQFAFQHGGEQLREMIAGARAAYRKLREQWEAGQ
jgi:hypothetical protein